MGAETFIQPGDIINANKKLLLAFCAQLFNTNPNLTVEVCLMSVYIFFGTLCRRFGRFMIVREGTLSSSQPNSTPA